MQTFRSVNHSLANFQLKIINQFLRHALVFNIEVICHSVNMSSRSRVAFDTCFFRFCLDLGRPSLSVDRPSFMFSCKIFLFVHEEKETDIQFSPDMQQGVVTNQQGQYYICHRQTLFNKSSLLQIT